MATAEPQIFVKLKRPKLYRVCVHSLVFALTDGNLLLPSPRLPINMGEPTSEMPRLSVSDEHPELQGAPPPSAAPHPPPPPSHLSSSSLIAPPNKKKSKAKVFRVFSSVFRSFPIITPATCKFPGIPMANPDGQITGFSGSKVTGTLFGCRKGRVSLSIQENPRCLPSAVIELAIQSSVLQKEMNGGMVRIALECEKKPGRDKTSLLDEPLWTMFFNGKKTGYSARREATEEDLKLMETLKVVTMGAGVVPGNSDGDGSDGELAYIRAHFDRAVGSKDSETLYMLSPEGNDGPELTVFFVRL